MIVHCAVQNRLLRPKEDYDRQGRIKVSAEIIILFQKAEKQKSSFGRSPSEMEVREGNIAARRGWHLSTKVGSVRLK